NIREIPLEVRTSNSQRRIVASHLVLEKHLHTAPFLFAGRSVPKSGNCPLKGLTAASRFEGQRAPRPGQTRRLLAEDGARSEGTNNFVVTHIQHPNVPVMPGT